MGSRLAPWVRTADHRGLSNWRITMPASDDPCVFCEIVQGTRAHSIIYEDDLTMAFLDRRQFHPGHVLPPLIKATMMPAG